MLLGVVRKISTIALCAISELVPEGMDGSIFGGFVQRILECVLRGIYGRIFGRNLESIPSIINKQIL